MRHARQHGKPAKRPRLRPEFGEVEIVVGRRVEVNQRRDEPCAINPRHLRHRLPGRALANRAVETHDRCERTRLQFEGDRTQRTIAHPEDRRRLIIDERFAPQGPPHERQVASHTAGLARFETVKKIALLEKEFSVEGGELTPTLKIKRRVIDEKYKAVIDRMYADDDQ